MYEDKTKVSHIAQTFGITSKQVYNTCQKIYKQRNPTIDQKKVNKFHVTQQMYDELENYLTNPLHRLSSLRQMRQHLLNLFVIPENKLCLVYSFEYVKEDELFKEKKQSLH